MENLDLACAALGQRLASIQGLEEKLLTDALSVLEEQGVYAFFLFLKARGKEPGQKISDACREFLCNMPAEGSLLDARSSDVFQGLQVLASDLDRLLFARDLLRQVLVYGRYHVKARSGSGGVA